MQIAEYTVPFPVRRYEVDRFGFVHDHVYQQYMEEAAIEASTAAGFGPNWYEEHGTVWVVRDIVIDYLKPASSDDTLEIRTWIADFHRVRSHREYEVYRQAGQQLLARASVDWVYVDRRRLWPIKIPAEAMTALRLNERYAVPPTRPVPALPAEQTEREFRSARKVQRHEVDGMSHVNNAIYVTWFEEGVLAALAACLPPAAQTGWPCWRQHHIEYLSAILPGEEVEIVTRLVGLGRARSAWHSEVRRRGSKEAAIRDDSIVFYLDDKRHPQRWPRDLAHMSPDTRPAGVPDSRSNS